MIVETPVLDLQVIEPHLFLLLLHVLALQGLFCVAGLLKTGGEVGDGEKNGLVELIAEGLDCAADLDHLGVALQVPFLEQGLALKRLGELRLEIRDAGMACEIRNLKQVAIFRFEIVHLFGINLETKPVEMRCSARGVDTLQPVADEVQAVVE